MGTCRNKLASTIGEVAEWSKAPAWKAGSPLKGLMGSNPIPSAISGGIAA